MNADELYSNLGVLIANSPEFIDGPLGHEERIWLGKAYALVSAVGDAYDTVRFKKLSAEVSLNGGAKPYLHELFDILFRALAVSELKASSAVRGAFINAGNALDVMAAVGKVLAEATITVRIVDPYMDEKALTDFAPLTKEGVAIELLSDEATFKSTLEPATARFKKQFDAMRPLKTRLAPKRALHDRLIIVDSKGVWSLTQSLKDMAERSPASIIRIDGDAAGLKIAAYDDFWKSARPIG